MQRVTVEIVCPIGAPISDQLDAILHFADQTRAVEPLLHTEEEQTAQMPETYPV